MNTRCVIIVIILLCAVFSGAANARTLQITDVRTIVTVSQPQVSPDGKSIAFVVSHPDYANNKDRNDLVMIDISSGHQSVLLGNRDDLSTPRWSPTGDRVAFIARDSSGGGEDQLFVLTLRDSSILRLTAAVSGVNAFAWRPDGSALAYVTGDVPANNSAIERHHDEFQVGNDGSTITAAPTSQHIWLVSDRGGAARRLTQGAWSVFGGDAGTEIAWSPDGKTIAFTKVPTPHLGDTNAAVETLVDIATGSMHQLTHHSGFENYATFSPDGKKIAYWYPQSGDGLNGIDAFVTPASGGNSIDITRKLDRDISSVSWMPDSRSLLVSAPTETRIALWWQPLEGKAQRLRLGDVDPAWDNFTDVTVGRDGSIAFSGISQRDPSEIYYMRSRSSPLRRLTNFNEHIAKLQLGRQATVTWHSPDGFIEDGVLTYPPDYQPGKKYPMVLRIHGGPNYLSLSEFWDFIQLAAARGYLVFQPNYRGSDNLGNAYEHAIFNDAGDGPGRDVMAGVAAVEKMGIVDASRLAVSGHSYGGYMGAWLIGHYRGWKAAVLYAGEFDALEQYDLEDYNVAEWIYFKGSPWVSDSVMRAYREQSPITYERGIKTPTLIVSNTGDARVPVVESFALYHALSDNHIPVKFVLFPESGHDITGPVHIEDLYRLWLDWFDRYLK